TWQWLKIDAQNPEMIREMNFLAGSISYLEFGIRDKSHWAVWDARRLKAIAIFTNDDAIAQALLSTNAMRELELLQTSGKLEQKNLNRVAQQDHKHRLILALFNHKAKRLIFVDA